MDDLLRRARRIAAGKFAAARHRLAGVDFDSTEEAQERPAAVQPLRDELARALDVLELSPAATSDEIKSAYRRLCRRYHPDRFDGDSDKSAVANELLAEINLAYARLTGKN